MSKNKAVFIIGIIFFIMPFLGFPSAWKSFFSVFFGLILVALSVWSSIRGRLGLPSLEKRGTEDEKQLFVDGRATADQAVREPETMDSAV